MTEHRAIVSIARGDDPLATAREAVGERLAQVIRRGDRVLLKVNQVGGMPPERGSTVSAELIGLAVELARECGAASVGIAEDAGRFGDTMKVFRELGTAEVARRTGAELVDLRQQPHRLVGVPGGGLAVREMEFAVPLLESDVLVGVTKLKTHHQAGITAAMKNMFGAVSDDYKRGFHRMDMGAAIVDINTIRKPDFSIVDGFPAMEGIGPHLGRPVPIHVTIAGRDPVAVDAVCQSVMGLPAGWARSVRLAAERGLGIGDLGRIEIQGAPISEVARRFMTPLEHFKEELRGYVEIVDGEACSGCSCVVGTVFMLLLGRYGKQLDDFRGLRVYLGKGADLPDLNDEKVFVVGNCAVVDKDHVRCKAGCPPSISDVMAMISASDVSLTGFGREVA